MRHHLRSPIYNIFDNFESIEVFPKLLVFWYTLIGIENWSEVSLKEVEYRSKFSIKTNENFEKNLEWPVLQYVPYILS